MWPHEEGSSPDDDIRDRVGVAPIEEKLVQRRLKWFGHIQGRRLQKLQCIADG